MRLRKLSAETWSFGHVCRLQSIVSHSVGGMFIAVSALFGKPSHPQCRLDYAFLAMSTKLCRFLFGHHPFRIVPMVLSACDVAMETEAE